MWCGKLHNTIILEFFDKVFIKYQLNNYLFLETPNIDVVFMYSNTIVLKTTCYDIIKNIVVIMI